MMPEVCIIGAGPAGSTASLYLSKNKIDHVLIDKAVFPRNVVCGEAFRGNSIYWALKHIDENYFEELKNTLLAPSNWVKLTNNKNEQLKVNLGNLLSFSGRRLDFDHFLLKKAQQSKHLRFIEGQVPKNIRFLPQQAYELSLDDGSIIRPKILMLATGSTSTLPQKLGIAPKDEQQKIIGLRAHYRNIAREEGSNDFYFFDFLQGGYFCILPLNEGYFNILLVLKNAVLQPDKPKIKTLFQQCMDHPFVKHRFKNAQLSANAQGKFLYLQKRNIQLSSDHLLVAGAAGLAVNPVTGYGVGHSMTAGRFAALRAVEALAVNDFSAHFLKKYDQRLLKKLKQERRVSAIKTALLKRPKLVNYLIRAFSKSESFSSLFARDDLGHHFYSPRYYWDHFTNWTLDKE